MLSTRTFLSNFLLHWFFICCAVLHFLSLKIHVPSLIKLQIGNINATSLFLHQNYNRRINYESYYLCNFFIVFSTCFAQTLMFSCKPFYFCKIIFSYLNPTGFCLHALFFLGLMFCESCFNMVHSNYHSILMSLQSFWTNL